MPNQTPNYNLVKPLTTENYDVNVFNGNADIIDTTLKSIDTQLDNIANNGFNGVGNSLNNLTDMNTFTTPGVYNVVITLSSSILNLPLYGTSSGQQRIKIEVTYDEPTKTIMTQQITYQDGVYTNRTFMRYRSTSTSWGLWVELLNSSRVVNNFTTNEDGFIADAKALKTLYDLVSRTVTTSIVVTLSETDHYDYTIPSGTLSTNPQILAVLGDAAGDLFVINVTRSSDTVIRIGFNKSFSGVIRINILYKIQ